MKRRSKKAKAEQPQKALAAEPQDRSAALLKMRFDAAIFPGKKANTENWADDLSVDRVPDAEGRIRALITVDDLVRLLDQGLEVHLFRAYPSEPLDPALIVSDESFKSWLEEKINALKAKPDPKPFIEP